RREVVWIGSRLQQPLRLRSPVPNLDPYRLYVGLVYVGAEHALAVFRSQHGRAHLHVLVGRAHGTLTQRPIVDVRRRRPCRAGGQGEKENNAAGCISQCTRRPRRRAHCFAPEGGVLLIFVLFSHGRTSISERDVGWRSNTSTCRYPSV